MSGVYEDDWGGGWGGGVEAPQIVAEQSPEADCGDCSCGLGCDLGCGCRAFTPVDSDVARARALRFQAQRDRASDAMTRAGLRLYGVKIVRVRSVGGRGRGDGVDQVVNSWDILPVPKVQDLASLSVVVSASQVREGGTVLVSEISGSYSEDVLMGRGADGSAIPRDEAVFWELSFADPTGRPSQRRRMMADTPPSYENNAWTITLRLSHAGRRRDGVPKDGGT